MVGPTAQLVALACHFNGRARGLPAAAFFPANSTCGFCESVRFVGPAGTAAATPDDWLDREAVPGRAAVLYRQPTDRPGVPDRLSAGMIGGGGRWSLLVRYDGRADVWQSRWTVGDPDAVDRRVWRVGYGRVAERIACPPPTSRPLDAIAASLTTTLADLAAFAEAYDEDGFAAAFRQAAGCLTADDPFAAVYHRDLAPDGLLGPAAGRLLAAVQSAWVFGGAGSWNDLGFEDGDEQARYDALSASLFDLLNEAVCAAANSAAAAAAVTG